MWDRTDLDPSDGSRTEQVAALIERRIERGDLAMQSRLPSERVLAAALGVSRVTVVRALGRLRGGGHLADQARIGDLGPPGGPTRRSGGAGLDAADRRATGHRPALRHHGRPARGSDCVRPARRPRPGHRHGRGRPAGGRFDPAPDGAGELALPGLGSTPTPVSSPPRSAPRPRWRPRSLPSTWVRGSRSPRPRRTRPRWTSSAAPARGRRLACRGDGVGPRAALAPVPSAGGRPSSTCSRTTTTRPV